MMTHPIILLYIDDKKRMVRALVARRHIPKLYIETSVTNGPSSSDPRVALASSAFWGGVKAGDLEAYIASYVLFELGKTLNREKSVPIPRLRSPEVYIW